MEDQLLDRHLEGATAVTDPKTIIRINDIKHEINDCVKKVKNGRTALFVLIGLFILAGLVASLAGPPRPDMTAFDVWSDVIVMCVLIGGCAALTFRKPFLGLALGLGFYLAYQVVIAVFVDPAMLFRGIIGKVAIFYFLVLGTLAAYELERHIGRLKRYPVAQEDLDRARRLEKVSRTPQVRS